ncbi:serpin family protein [Bacillus paralicheniformis]|uniref:serpin family protein n=1 Tax=Bacillus TaxID=1386 RepID=UPI0003A64DDC|nr:serpin family protein [Bacillus paralicheniformis]KJD55568.1 proteinase inhibitor [Bacillus amyloliquefaciens]KUL09231.1 proteinase inhibitor [Bacillus licheniformis LMG 7559]AYQ14881.1 proteinase inhibitor [Bacillus paralicheniformis]KND07326.1 proteinase inhibitor [Bacillus paralicheniformis]MBX9435148.1 serpin family protein [Bacillus paralicheniformis]
MKSKWSAMVIWTGLLLLAGCGVHKEADPPPVRSAQKTDASLSEAEQRFALALFQDMIKEEGSRKNIFLSPYSIHQALVMTANGAAGDSRKELLGTLNLNQTDMTSINRMSQSVNRSLETLPHGEFSSANSIWSKRELKESFQDAIKGLGDAYQLHDAEEINGWVKKKTKDRIDQIVDKVSSNTIAYIINAVYFRESWKHPFDPHMTAEQPFYSADGSAKKHPMMTQTNRFPYLENKHFQAVKLPFQDEGLSLAVFLPKKAANLEQLLAGMTYDQWRALHKGWTMKQVELKLPRFSFQTDYMLNEPLKRLGMKTVFSSADFSNMFAGEGAAQIDKVRHKTFIKVDEAGTEASAATAVEIIESAPVPEVTMTADHPFYFAIVDETSGMNLFVGSVAEPSDE